MDPITAFIILGAVVAGFVQGLSGFAFTMLAMSIWAWVLEPQLAAATAVFGGMCGQIFGVLAVRRGFDPKILIPLCLGGLAGIPIGVSVLPHLDADLFKSLLGAMLTSSRVRVIGLDGKVGPLVEEAMQVLCQGGFLPTSAWPSSGRAPSRPSWPPVATGCGRAWARFGCVGSTSVTSRFRCPRATA